MKENYNDWKQSLEEDSDERTQHNNGQSRGSRMEDSKAAFDDYLFQWQMYCGIWFSATWGIPSVFESIWSQNVSF